MNLIKKFINSPFYLMLFFIISLSLVLLIINGLKLPEYYINKGIAWQFMQTLPINSQQAEAMQKLNPRYNLINSLFKIWAWLVSFSIVIVVTKIKTWSDFKNLPIIENKKFIYVWINISFILFAISALISTMNDLSKYVYPSGTDSIGIALFFMIGFMVMIAIIYYPLINLLFFIIYNTKITNKFYSFVCILGIFFIILSIILTQYSLFCFTFLFDNIYYIDYRKN